MRLRILVPLILMMLAATAVGVIPVYDSFAREHTSQLALSRSAALDRLRVTAERALDADVLSTFQHQANSHYQVFGEAVMVVDASGAVVVRAGEIDQTDPAVSHLLERAKRNLHSTSLPLLSVVRTSDQYLAAPVLTETDFVGGALVIAVNDTAAVAALRRQTITMAAVVSLLVAGLVTIAWFVTRWILRPIDKLEAAVSQLADGDRPLESPTTGPPEMQRLARAFNTMAGTVTDTLEQQRRFVADSSHLLRNPLAGLRLRVDALGLQLGSDTTGAVDKARRNLGEFETDLARLERLVDDLLDLADADQRAAAQRDSGRRPDGVTPGPLLTDVLARWRTRVEDAGMTLDVDPGADVGALPLDDPVAHDMVDTLLENAVKYAGHGAAIAVAVTAEADSVVVSVADSGPGLNAEEYELARQRFWRSARHRDHHGTGLGLAIVDQLARSYGGRLELGPADQGGLRAAIRFPTAHASRRSGVRP